MATYDKPIPVTCPACLAQEEAEVIFEAAAESDPALEDMIKRNFDYLWAKHTRESGCTFHPCHLASRTLPCGCLVQLLGLPKCADRTYDPDAVREHVTACKARELAGRISDYLRSPPFRSDEETIFKGIEMPNKLRPDWFWELWVRKPLTSGSADDLQEEGGEFGDDLA